jgi:hypothetical protein
MKVFVGGSKRYDNNDYLGRSACVCQCWSTRRQRSARLTAEVDRGRKALGVECVFLATDGDGDKKEYKD